MRQCQEGEVQDRGQPSPKRGWPLSHQYSGEILALRVEESSCSHEGQASQGNKQDRRENPLTSVLHPNPHPSEYGTVRRRSNSVLHHSFNKRRQRRRLRGALPGTESRLSQTLTKNKLPVRRQCVNHPTRSTKQGRAPRERCLQHKSRGYVACHPRTGHDMY